jgi:hypothetical protein
MLREAGLVERFHGCYLLCQDEFSPGIVENGNVPRLRSVNNNIRPILVFIGPLPRCFLSHVLQVWGTRQIANLVVSFLLGVKPLLESQCHC